MIAKQPSHVEALLDGTHLDLLLAFLIVSLSLATFMYLPPNLELFTSRRGGEGGGRKE